MKQLKVLGARLAQSAAARGLATAGTLMGLASAARADVTFTLDPAPIVTTIAGAVTVISAIGVAVLSLAVVIKLFKWVQRVL